MLETLKKNKYAAAGLIIVFLLLILNLFFIYSHLDKSVELLHYDSQSMYHESFIKDGRYPDLLLRLLVRGKKVKVASEVKTYDEYGTYGRDEEDGNPFDRNYLIENDYTRWFRQYAKEVEIDGSLLRGEQVGDVLGPRQESFLHLGIANDMLRYSFPLNEEHVQQASAFWYSWYYQSYAERKAVAKKPKDFFPDIYVRIEDFPEADTYVAVWGANQDLYLMGEETYENLAELGGKTDISLKSVIDGVTGGFFLRQVMVILFLFLTGFAFIALIRQGMDFIWQSLLAYPTGLSLYALVSCGILFAGIPFNLVSVIIAMGLVLALTALCR